MSDVTRHTLTHKLLATDTTGETPVQWYGSWDGGESYVGLGAEPEPGSYAEFARGRPISLAYPGGFRILRLEPGEPIDLGMDGKICASCQFSIGDGLPGHAEGCETPDWRPVDG